jgi:hypothetical protein
MEEMALVILGMRMILHTFKTLVDPCRDVPWNVSNPKNHLPIWLRHAGYQQL